ncbi:hypothetical protein C8A01DRAFT_21173, partial [Parachaetomium inaequale]
NYIRLGKKYSGPNIASVYIYLPLLSERDLLLTSLVLSNLSEQEKIIKDIAIVEEALA